MRARLAVAAKVFEGTAPRCKSLVQPPAASPAGNPRQSGAALTFGLGESLSAGRIIVRAPDSSELRHGLKPTQLTLALRDPRN